MSQCKAVFLTTGIPTVSSAWYWAYHLLILLIVTAFAVYDIKTKRIPNKALKLSCVVALASPVIYTWNTYSGVFEWSAMITPLLSSFLGAAAGFVILLAAALASKGGNGVGGGDIKLAAVLGFVYRPAGIIAILLCASLLALPAGLTRRRRTAERNLHMAFVPFIAVGCLAITAIKLI